MVEIINEAFETPVIFEAATLAFAAKHIEQHEIDLVVLDLDLPDGRGEEFIPQILQSRPSAYVVIASIHDESNRLLTALKAGAKGYLLKEQDADQLVRDFRGILTGKPPLAPTVARRLLEFLREDQAVSIEGTSKPSMADAETVDLTKREEEILVYLAKGFSRPEIGGMLNISKHTVATHTDKIYRKLGVTTRSEAAVIAQQRHLL